MVFMVVSPVRSCAVLFWVWCLPILRLVSLLVSTFKTRSRSGQFKGFYLGVQKSLISTSPLSEEVWWNYNSLSWFVLAGIEV
ncbi:unnamed protein product [Arabidopsis lyrata]|nr:unnamed protein product [Arabidopsis lyrata]